MFSALLLGLVASARGAGSPPPNPLGENTVGMQAQYRVLRDKFGVDASEDIGSYCFEIETPPLFLDLARQEVGAAWKDFVSSEYHSQCLTRNEPTVEYGGQCKKTLSELRDALQKYSALYPTAGSRYKWDPYDTIQEDIAHQGYSRQGNMVDRLLRDQTQGEQYYNQQILPWLSLTLNTIGEYGDKHIFGRADLPTWSDYVLLKGTITNEGTALTSHSPFNPRFDSDALTNKQFWGIDASNGAKEGFDGFENLGLLFRTQLGNAFGNDPKKPDRDWYEVMSFTDLTAKQYGSYVAELKFHDLRKIIRMMWRTMTDSPQIVPLNFITQSYPCKECRGGHFPALSAPAQELHDIKIEGKSLLDQIFLNSAESRAWLKKLGWDEAAIQLATSMALGGFYHLDHFTFHPEVTDEYAEAHMDSNVGMNWDFVQRMGYIHDMLLDYTLQESRGVGGDVLVPLKDRINGLWRKFVKWCDTNVMLDLLKYKLDPYMPVGNETASRELAPALPVSNLPFLYIDTHGQQVPCTTLAEVEACARMTSAQASINATLKLYEFSTRDEPVVYNISLKAHGESSKGWPKKTYGLKFWNKSMNDTKDVKFLGLPSNDEWVLKGFYVDMTLNRDALAYNLSRSMFQWAPRTRQTEVYLVTDKQEMSYALHYIGVYTVAEEIGRGKNRIDIPKNGVSTDDVTGARTVIPPGEGGFIFAVDKFDPQVDSFVTLPKTGNQVTIKYPGKSNLQPEQQAWAWSLLEEFEDDMFGPDWLNASSPNGWARWIDLDSWATYFITSEIMKSVDAYRFSTYFWTEGANSTIKFGPPWDYDLSSANTGWVVDLNGQAKQPHSWQYMLVRTISTDNYGTPQSIPQAQHTPNAADWFYRLFDVPEFKSRVSRLYWEFRQKDNVLSDERVKAVLADQKQELKKGSNRNFAKWATLDRVDIWPHYPPPIQPTLDGRWQELEDYLLARLDWMDKNIHGYMPHDNIHEGTTCGPGQRIPDCLNMDNSFAPWRGYEGCNGNPYVGFWWVRSNWQSSLKFFMNTSRPHTDGTDCSVLEYLHWEFTEGLGPVDCPVPGGPDKLIAPYPDPAAPMACPAMQCGRGTKGVNDYCAGTIEWLMAHWRENPKYAAGGVDGSVCSCQRFLATEGKCPAPQGSDRPLYCVDNRCQPEYGTSAPTAPWQPTPPPTRAPTASFVPTAAPTTAEPSVPPTAHPTDHPTQSAAPTAPTTASPTRAAPPTLPPTPLCGHREWCDDSDDPECELLNGVCSQLGEDYERVGDDIPCSAALKLEECCSRKTCLAFEPTCTQANFRPKDQREERLGCMECNERECCVYEEPLVAPTAAPRPPKKNFAIAGYVALVVAVVALAAAGGFWYYRRVAKKQHNNFVTLNSDHADYHEPVDNASF